MMRDYSSSIQRRKRGKRTEYIARLNYYDRGGKRRSVSRSTANPGDAKLQLQDLITKHVHGGAELLEARTMTFADLAEDCRKNRYCEAIYDKHGCKLAGVRDPKVRLNDKPTRRSFGPSQTE
jgi:hypothetical protein